MLVQATVQAISHKTPCPKIDFQSTEYNHAAKIILLILLTNVLRKMELNAERVVLMAARQKLMHADLFNIHGGLPFSRLGVERMKAATYLQFTNTSCRNADLANELLTIYNILS